MREELKGRNLSFTEIAKLVGENWQNLNPSEKEPFESQAQSIKERYLADLAQYKKTADYRKYMAYLQEFKAKHAPQGMCPVSLATPNIWDVALNTSSQTRMVPKE
jgi:HMG (high mobility group) box